MRYKFSERGYSKSVIVVLNNLIPFKGYVAINILGIIFVRKDYKKCISDNFIRHELIHTEQMKECFYIGFYFLYVVFWLCLLAKHRNFNKAYREIPFEKEAYKNDYNNKFLGSREKFNWVNYV